MFSTHKLKNTAVLNFTSYELIAIFYECNQFTNKHKRGIAESATSIYAVISWNKQPFPRYYHSRWFQYRRKSAVFPSSPLPCSSLVSNKPALDWVVMVDHMMVSEFTC